MKLGYIGINLTEKVKNLYIESYRKLKKEVEEDTTLMQSALKHQWYISET